MSNAGAPAPRIDHYDWAGGREAMLRFGPDEGRVVVAALPLFEEANRVRAFTVTLLRALARRGIAGALPDLPGTGESLSPAATTTLAGMRAAYAAAVARVARGERQCYAVGIRSGALFDAGAAVAGRWHLAPQTGEALMREQLRIALLAGAVPARSDIDVLTRAETTTMVAGHALTGAMATDLLVATFPEEAGPRRTVRLDGDHRTADRHLSGPALWRRAEPDNDARLAETLADDIRSWAGSCGD